MALTRPINVLHLRSCRGGGGGPEKTILFSAKESNSSFRQHIAYLRSNHDPEFDLDRRAASLAISDFFTIGEDGKIDVSALKRLLKLLREKDIHVLHCHCYKSDLYGLILSRFHRMKLVTTVHGPLASLKYFWTAQNWRVRYIYDQLDLRLLRFFDHVMMVSDSMRPIVMGYGVRPNRLTWVKNAIDSSFFRRSDADHGDLRARFGIPVDATVIGAIGRLNGEKDYPNFLEMAQILNRSRSNIHFAIAGKGELDGFIRNRIQEMNLEGRVHMLGHFHDVRSIYQMLDVYVLSSTREGLPNTVLEAMAMEVPIAATDVDGVAEAAAADREALLVPARDPARLADAVSKLLDDTDLASKLTFAARKKIENEFSFAGRVRHEERIYAQVLGYDLPPTSPHSLN
jgi:glycosyltransferase involved in cell wall biosynthesis